jgi:hypothetical protein
VSAPDSKPVATRSRLSSLWPLFVAYTVLGALYAWQAWRRETPTLFSDEIEFTQVSRSIAETGQATLRVGFGQPATSVSLFAYLAAPAWWLSDVHTAYMLIKLLGVALMTATIFPAYGLARLVVSRPYAIFAAVGAVLAPALSYSPFLVDEPVAYPAAALAFLLMARAAVTPTRRSIGLALGSCLLGLFVRTQLAVLFVVLALVLLARLWRAERMRRWRETWSPGDWVGFAVLLIGFAVVLSAALGRRSFSWYVATGFLKERMLEYGLWAVGALAIGIGIVPLLAALAVIVRPRGEARDERTTSFITVLVSALAVFGLYTAIKAAYLSTTLAIVVAERNLIYLTPLLFIGLALALERRRLSLPATVCATAFAVYLMSATPYRLDTYPYYDAHGLAITALANRIGPWPADTIETVLIAVALGSGLALILLALARSRQARFGGAAAIAVFALAWSLTTEIYAANGEKRASDRAYSVLPKPADWVDKTTGGQSALFIGQGVSDANAFWQLEFWNPSIKWFWGMDGSTPGGVTPNLLRPDGTQDPANLGAEFAVVSKGVQIAAPKVTTVGDYVVFRLGGKPVQLRETTAGIGGDGWMGAEASYTRYDVSGLGRGFVKVVLSRGAACFEQLEPALATVKVGPVVVSKSDQPGIGTVTASRTVPVFACQPNPVVLRVPRAPWRVEVTIDPTFVPRELDPNLPDTRHLGAVATFEFQPLKD